MVGTQAWTVWGLQSVVVTEPASMLEAAVQLVQQVLQEVDEACSRFRPDSELMRLSGQLADGTEVSELLALLVTRALDVAKWTDGNVDPTLGNDLAVLGYDRDFAQLDPPAALPAARIVLSVPRRPGWQRVNLDGRHLQIPADLQLDLGASAKALAADLAAAKVHAVLGGGVLVSLGGDLATAGPPPENGWEILVQDTITDPGQQVLLPAGAAMATSSTQKRRWQQKGQTLHHILDPRYGLPADPVWRTVTVAAESCLRANALSTASVVRGRDAVGWLRSLQAPARLVDRAGNVMVTGSWPEAAYVPAEEAAHE